MELDIEITSEKIRGISDTLIGILADEFILYVQTRKAHWNVEDQESFALRKIFEEQYDQIGEVIDDVAGRIRSMGHRVPATLDEYLRLTHLTDGLNQANDNKGFLRDLLRSHENFILDLKRDSDSFRQKLDDSGISHFLSGIVAAHEKMAHLLRSQLNNSPCK